MMKMSARKAVSVALAATIWMALLACRAPVETETEDPRMAGFKGVIARSYEDSVEDWPEEPTFTGEEPNVLILLLDDVGYAQLGAYGGLTETPNIDPPSRRKRPVSMTARKAFFWPPIILTI